MPDRTKSGRLGAYITKKFRDESFRAFVPPPLPPNPPVDLAPLQRLLAEANQALGRLDGLASSLPDPSLFIYLYVRKEAVLSSQIEGTQSSLADLLLYESRETPGVPIADVEEVSAYVSAMNHGMRRLREGFPLSLRLIKEIHRVLVRHGRGSDQRPGEFRTSQNWIGGTRPGNAAFVPPPPEDVMKCMGALESFLHKDSADMPPLVKAALAHVQFETIHPFLDGNGRLGRLLITLLLCVEEAIRAPILYLSLYFKQHRAQYYQLLDGVRTRGDWETWVEFFLNGVKETSAEAAANAHQILKLLAADRKTIHALGRPAASALRVHEYLQRKPITSIRAAAAEMSLSAPTVAKSMRHLQALGLVEETTGRQRHRLFRYERYIEVLNRGMSK